MRTKGGRPRRGSRAASAVVAVVDVAVGVVAASTDRDVALVEAWFARESYRPPDITAIREGIGEGPPPRSKKYLRRRGLRVRRRVRLSHPRHGESVDAERTDLGLRFPATGDRRSLRLLRLELVLGLDVIDHRVTDRHRRDGDNGRKRIRACPEAAAQMVP